MPALRRGRPLVADWASLRPAGGSIPGEIAGAVNLIVALRLQELPTTRGACHGADRPDVFFADGRQHSSIAAAKEMCRRCDIQKECLARGEGEYGIWGGETQAERGAA